MRLSSPRRRGCPPGCGSAKRTGTFSSREKDKIASVHGRRGVLLGGFAGKETARLARPKVGVETAAM